MCVWCMIRYAQIVNVVNEHGVSSSMGVGEGSGASMNACSTGSGEDDGVDGARFAVLTCDVHRLPREVYCHQVSTQSDMYCVVW